MNALDRYYSDCVRIELVNTAVTDTVVKGPAIDRMGFGSLLFAVGSRLTAGTATLSLEHSDELAGTYVAVDIEEQVLNSDAVPMSTTVPTGKIGYAGFKRYVKLVVTPTGATGGVFALAILGSPDCAPAA